MSEKTKYPGENGLVAMFQLIEDKIKYLKNSIIELIDAANCVFYVKLKLGANGFELDDVTYADIIEAYDSGKRIVAKAVVPAEANLGFDGNFEIPMTYVDDDGMFAFSFTTGLMNCEVFLSSSGSISYSIREYREKDTDGSSSESAVYYLDVNFSAGNTCMLSDEAISELVTAYESGKVIMARELNNNHYFYWNLCSHAPNAFFAFSAFKQTGKDAASENSTIMVVIPSKMATLGY